MHLSIIRTPDSLLLIQVSVTCPQGHLVKYDTNASFQRWRCDGFEGDCHGQHSSYQPWPERYRCTSCDYDYCPQCYRDTVKSGVRIVRAKIKAKEGKWEKPRRYDDTPQPLQVNIIYRWISSFISISETLPSTDLRTPDRRSPCSIFIHRRAVDGDRLPFGG